MRRIQIWATAGGMLLAVQVYVWVRWVAGPYFERVPGGSDSPPMYMKAFLTMNAVVVCVVLPVAIWWFIIRPWSRERRITLDSILLVSMGLMFFPAMPPGSDDHDLRMLGHAQDQVALAERSN